MAAPTNAANVKKALANPEPSTHGTSPRLVIRNVNRGTLVPDEADSFAAVQFGRYWHEADVSNVRFDVGSWG